MPEGTKKPRYKKFNIDLPEGPLALFAGTRVIEALKEVTTDMTIYKGVRLAQVMKAVYVQGQKDGRREVIEQLEKIKKTVKYLPPGRPRGT